MTRRLATLTLLLMLAGCGSHEIDQAAWEADLAKHSVTVSDWPKYRSAIADVCEDSQSELEAYIAVSRDGEQSDAVNRVNIQHACPDRSEDLDKAIASVDNSSSTVQHACDTAPEDRTASQERLAEAMGC